MFSGRFFGLRYFARRYFGKFGAAPTVVLPIRTVRVALRVATAHVVTVTAR